MSENQNLNINPENQNLEATEKSVKKVASIKQGSKLSKLIEMLKSPDGTTIKQISEKLNWQNHTARGVLSRLRNNYDVNITTDGLAGKNRTYKIAWGFDI